MELLFIGIALIILCLPITLRSRSLAVAESQFVLNNIKIGLIPTLAIKIELTADGVVFKNNVVKKKGSRERGAGSGDGSKKKRRG
jgi:hypothetical protein